MNARAASAPIRVLAALSGRDGDAIAARFLITGCSVALLFFMLSAALVRVGMTPFDGTISSYAVCFVIAYATQRGWTFGGGHRHRDALPRYLVAQVGCALLSGLLARLLAGEIAPLAAAASVTVVSSGVSYLLSRFWVFRCPRADPAA